MSDIKYGTLSDSDEKEHYVNRRSRLLKSGNKDKKYNDSSDSESLSTDDEFEMLNDPYFTLGKMSGLNALNLKSGRERRKKVARGKGGDFYEKRRKRRVYVCTLADEIDLTELKEHILASNCTWITKHTGDALVLSKPMRNFRGEPGNFYIPRRRAFSTPTNGNIEQMLSERERSYISNKKSHSDKNRNSSRQRQRSRHSVEMHDAGHQSHESDKFQDVADPRHQEVVVFEFGSVVFWGFSVGEESVMLQTIKDFAMGGRSLVASEFTASEDDMAFISHLQTPKRRANPATGGREYDNELDTPVTTVDDDNGAKDNDAVNANEDVSNWTTSNSQEVIDLNGVIIANDVISFPEKTTREHRLAVSYAIAQSSIVAIFEERIMQKVAEYKFIPETLASVGKIDLSSKRIGMMIGEIFVIRHDLNLHSDILDTPDFFWGEQDRFVDDYERITRYLEMDGRVEVLNTRLNMLRDLLDVLNQQMENDHSTKLEWIIIWLIVIEVVIQLTSVGITIF